MVNLKLMLFQDSTNPLLTHFEIQQTIDAVNQSVVDENERKFMQAWCTVQVFSSLHLLSVLKTDAAFALYLIASSLHVVSVLKADVAFELYLIAGVLL